MSDDIPSMYEAIVSAIEARITSLFGPMPAKVTAYDYSTQKVSVQPLIYRAREDEEGDRVAERLGIVENVPLMFPGGGAYRVTWPVNVGDLVLLVFADSSMDRWLARGGEVDPEDDRRFHLSDAVAIPGMYHYADIPTSAPTDAMVLHADMVKLGTPSAADPVARKSDLDAVVNKLNAFITLFNAHTHILALTSGTGTAAPTASPETSLTNPTCSAVVSVP